MAMEPVSDETLESLNDYAASGCVSAPPDFLRISADTLYDMVCELQARRGIERGNDPSGYRFQLSK